MPSYQPERVPVLVNGTKVYLRGAVEYDVNTGARIGLLIRDALSYGDIVARSGVSSPKSVLYSDSTVTRTLLPGDAVIPALDGVFTVR